MTLHTHGATWKREDFKACSKCGTQAICGKSLIDGEYVCPRCFKLEVKEQHYGVSPSERSIYYAEFLDTTPRRRSNESSQVSHQTVRAEKSSMPTYNCPYCGEKFDNIIRAERHFNECDKKRFEVPRHIPAGSQNPTTLEVQLTEDEAFLMLNGLLAYIEPIVRDFVTSMPIESWMVTAVKLTKRLYYTLTEAYPSLRKEQAIRQWWDDQCSRTGKPYYEEYDRFIATFEASN